MIVQTIVQLVSPLRFLKLVQVQGVSIEQDGFEPFWSFRVILTPFRILNLALYNNL